MHRLTRTVLVGIAGVVVAGPAHHLAARQDTGLPARVVTINQTVRTETYPTHSYGFADTSSDDRKGTTTWRVVERTGNCCENYLTATGGGRLLDFGGSYLNFSDDDGLTWRSVRPQEPLVNGEGAVTVAPGGDILGVQWDPYSGDHLLTFKYEAHTGTWRYLEMPVHQPFYDREWIAVLKGPFTIAGQTVPYISFIKGGVPKEFWYYSLDGLTYALVTSKFVEQLNDDAQRTLGAATPDPDFDFIQPNANGGMFPVGASRLVASGDLDSNWSIFDGREGSFTRVVHGDGTTLSGLYAVDAAGRLHNVLPQGAQFLYRWSADGGRTWASRSVRLPENAVVEEIDFRANKSAGIAAVVIRAQDTVADVDRDMVYKIGIKDARPKLLRRYDVGLGDLNSTAGLGNSSRMDFQTVAILDDGRLAVSFLDSTTTNRPAVAIELATELSGPAEGPSSGPEPGTAQAPISTSVLVPATGAGVRGCGTTSGCVQFIVPDGADDASLQVDATPGTAADVDLYFQRKLPDGTWSDDIVAGTSGSLSGETMFMGRLTPGETYRIEAHLWAGLPGTTVALKATFFNTAGVAGQ